MPSAAISTEKESLKQSLTARQTAIFWRSQVQQNRTQDKSLLVKYLSILKDRASLYSLHTAFILGLCTGEYTISACAANVRNTLSCTQLLQLLQLNVLLIMTVGPTYYKTICLSINLSFDEHLAGVMLYLYEY